MGGTPKIGGKSPQIHGILIGFSIVNYPFLGYPYIGKHPDRLRIIMCQLFYYLWGSAKIQKALTSATSLEQ